MDTPIQSDLADAVIWAMDLLERKSECATTDREFYDCLALYLLIQDLFLALSPVIANREFDA